MKYLGINLKKIFTKATWGKSQISDERNLKSTKLMKRYFMFMDRKTQYCQDISSCQLNL